MLIGLFVVQVAVAVVLFWPRDVSGGAGAPLFPDFAAPDVVGITITDNSGTTLRLAANDRGWTLPEADNFPARKESVESLLEGIAELETDRLVTRTEPSHRALQVADESFVRRVVFEREDGSTRAFYLGSSPRYGLSHVRLFGEDEVYLTDALLTWDVGTSASAWIDTSYVSVPRAEADRIDLVNAEGSLEFARESADADGESTWTLVGLEEDEILNEASVNSLLNQALAINMVAPIGRVERAAFEMDSPNAVVTIETGDEKVSVVIGAADSDDANYVVKASTSPYFVHVAKWNLSSLVDYGRDDFLEAPPDPEVEGSSDSGASE